MSGLEVLGVLLGGLSLTVSGIEDYRKVYHVVLRWRDFDKDLAKFLKSVKNTRKIFELIVERVLCEADISRQDIKNLLDHPRDSEWRRQDLAQAVAGNLGSANDTFLDMVGNMQDLVKDLNKALSIEDGEIYWLKGGNRGWQYHLNRIYFSISRTCSQTLDALKDVNEQLNLLVDVAMKRKHAWHTRNYEQHTKAAFHLQRIRGYASGLYAALQSGWNRDCVKKHNVSLQLESRRDSPQEPVFNIVIELHSGGEVLRQEFVSSLFFFPAATPLFLDHYPTRPTFQDVADSRLPSKILNKSKIKNLCVDMTRDRFSGPRSHPGLLKRGNEYHRLQRVSKKNVDASSTMVSLGSILADGIGRAEIRLSQKDRMTIGLHVGSSIVQLQRTAWCTSKFSKENIFFYFHGSQLLSKEPFITREFPTTSRTVARPSQSTLPREEVHRSVENDMIALGILLLELWFDSPIEDQFFRKSHLHEGQVTKDTDFMTAKDWLWYVEEENMEMYSVIRNCLFGWEEPLNWKNTEFVLQVYSRIVRPLEKIAETCTG